jgi:hypothetical protein
VNELRKPNGNPREPEWMRETRAILRRAWATLPPEAIAYADQQRARVRDRLREGGVDAREAALVAALIIGSMHEALDMLDIEPSLRNNLALVLGLLFVGDDPDEPAPE